MKHNLYNRSLSLLVILSLLLTGLLFPVVAVPVSEATDSSNTSAANDELLVTDKTVPQAGAPVITGEGKILEYIEDEGEQTLAVADVSPGTDSAISLNYTIVSVVEGGTLRLVATTNPSGQTVTWSSSDTSVAFIRPNGTVLIGDAGTATITATMVDTNGATHRASCTVYVYVADGVYYIQNDFSGYYLHVHNGRVTGLPNVFQFIRYGNAASDAYRIHQLWKIRYLSQGKYSIRPMHKLDMALDMTLNNVDVYNIGTADGLANVPVCALWTIEGNSSGYIFKNNGLDNCVLQVENAATTSGANVIADTDPAANTSGRWKLEKVTSPPTGVVLYDTGTNTLAINEIRYVAPEQTYSLSALQLSPAFYSGTSILQDFEWYSSDESKATVDSSTGEVTGVSAGMVTITGRKNHNGTYYYVSYTLIVTGVPDGTYFMENKQTGYYADIENQTMAAGTTIQQWDFHGGDSQRWVFNHLGDGYYTIKSNNATTPHFLGVINDSAELDVDIVLRTGTITDGMKWKVELTASGAYKIIPKTGEASGYVLATSTSNASNGYKLIQGDYIDNNSYRDEWFLHKQCDYVLMYIGDDVGDPLMTPIINAVNSALEDNAGMDGYGYAFLTKKELLVSLSSADIFSCITHGKQTSLKASDGWFSMEKIEALDNSAFDNLKFVYFGACETGKGRNTVTNLVNTVYNKGADAVLGFTIEINRSETNLWTEKFMIALSNGLTIESAMSHADNEVRSAFDDLNNPNMIYTTAYEYRYFLGSRYVVLCN